MTKICRTFGWTFWCDLPQSPCSIGYWPVTPSNCSENSLVLFVRFFGFVSPFWLLNLGRSAIILKRMVVFLVSPEASRLRQTLKAPCGGLVNCLAARNLVLKLSALSVGFPQRRPLTVKLAWIKRPACRRPESRTPILCEEVPHQHLEGSLVYMFLSFFSF